jgi:hypothetical protein
MHNAVAPKTDLFFAGLNWMLDEEKYICTQTEKTNLNRQLSEELQTLIYKYTNRLNEVQQNKKYIELSTIYNLIKIIGDIPEVYIQVSAAKRTRENTLEQYEHKVPND